MFKTSLTLTAVVGLLLSNVNIANAGPGVTGAQFLKIEPSARSTAMGGAYSAVGNDTDSIYYNPAGLANLKSREFSATYVQYIQDITYGFTGGALPLGESSAIGAGVTFLSVSNLEKRSVTSDSLTPDSLFGATDMALTLSYAHSVGDGLNLGTNVKLINQSIESVSAGTVAVDFATFYKMNDYFSVALNLQNIGNGIKFVEEVDLLPANLKLGISYVSSSKLTLACDVNNYLVDEKLYACLGMEYWLNDTIAIRAGYKSGYDTESLGSSTGIGVGLGIMLSGLGIDYAFVPYGELGTAQRISVSLKF
jgi:long-subunit fatty acid transport protein